MKYFTYLSLGLFLSLTQPSTFAQITFDPDPGCESYEAWRIQSNVQSSTTGKTNIAFPEAHATYWATPLNMPLSTVVTIKGRFPRARYMALQLYDASRSVRDAINDQDINPDPGTNNPYRTGTDQGTYTVKLVYGKKPRVREPNTIYTDGLTDILILYRIYYSNNPDDLSAETTNPVLPAISLGAHTYTSCPVRPIVPTESTVWGRLDNSDWAGTVPPKSVNRTTNPPEWNVQLVREDGLYYPSADNSYLLATLSREYFLAPYNYDMVVIRLVAPTFPNTQAGEAPYLATTDRQVRFWSICQNEPSTSSVNRCIADNQALLQNGIATIVISDPSKKPADSVLQSFGAVWMNWGALQPGDFLYDVNLNQVYNDQPVYYYGAILYRQTVANPSWTQSIGYVGQNYPPAQRKAAMGIYWPSLGYCRAADFAALGGGCLEK